MNPIQIYILDWFLPSDHFILSKNKVATANTLSEIINSDTGSPWS
jgi:hypothetical protein